MFRLVIISALLFLGACGQPQFSIDTEPNRGSGDAEVDDDMMVKATATSLLEIGLEDIANPTAEETREMTIGDPQRSTSIRLTLKRPPQKALNNKSSKGKLDILMVIDSSSDNGSRKINYDKIAVVIQNFLTAISAVDWKLTLAGSESYGKSKQLERLKASSSISSIVKKIKDIRKGVQKSWRTYDEHVVWKARNVLGDVDQSGAKAWKGGAKYPETQRMRNFFPYSVWSNNKWIKDSTYSNHSWLRANAKLAVLLISDEDHQCTRARSCSITPKPKPCSFSGLGKDTAVINKQGVPKGYKWNSFDCGINDHLVFELNYNKEESNWRLFGIFDIKTKCNQLGSNYDPNSVWIKNSNKKHVNPCFKKRHSNMKSDSLAFAFSYKTRYAEHFSKVFDLNAGSSKYANFPQQVMQDIGDNLIEARYNLGFTCDKNKLSITIGGQPVKKDEYEINGNELKFKDDKIFLKRKANYGLAICNIEVLNTTYRLRLGNYTGTPRCGTDNQCSSSISCTYSGNRLTLNSTAGLKNNDKVYVCYEAAQGMENRIELPAARVKDSVKLAVNGSHACDESQLTLSNNAIMLSSGCAAQHNKAGNKLAATFKAIATQQEFTVGEPQSSSTVYSKEEWKVFVNGLETHDYQRNDRVLTLTGNVPPDSKVKVELHLIP